MYKNSVKDTVLCRSFSIRILLLIAMDVVAVQLAPAVARHWRRDTAWQVEACLNKGHFPNNWPRIYGLDETARGGACTWQHQRFKQDKLTSPADCKGRSHIPPSAQVHKSTVTTQQKPVFSASPELLAPGSHTDIACLQASEHPGFQLWDVWRNTSRGGQLLQESLWKVWPDR